jgi:hypothetical protein
LKYTNGTKFVKSQPSENFKKKRAITRRFTKDFLIPMSAALAEMVRYRHGLNPSGAACV